MDHLAIPQAVTKLLRNRLVQACSAGALLFSYVGHMSDGFQYWSWVMTNWGWLVNLARSPYFFWAIGLSIIGLFWIGVVQTVKAQTAAALTRTAADMDLLAEIRALLGEATRLPNLIAKHSLLERKTTAFAVGIETLKEKTAVSQQVFSAICEGHAVDRSGELARMFNEINFIYDFGVRAGNPPKHKFEPPAPPSLTVGGSDVMGNPYLGFDPAKNQEWLTHARIFLERATEFVPRAETKLGQLRKECTELNSAVAKEQERLVNG